MDIVQNIIEDIAAAQLELEQKQAIITYLYDSIELDRKRQAALLKATLKVGDEVELFGLRPPSINGTITKVLRIRKTRIEVDIPGRGLSTVPLSCVRKV